MGHLQLPALKQRVGDLISSCTKATATPYLMGKAN